MPAPDPAPIADRELRILGEPHRLSRLEVLWQGHPTVDERVRQLRPVIVVATVTRLADGAELGRVWMKHAVSEQLYRAADRDELVGLVVDDYETWLTLSGLPREGT